MEHEKQGYMDMHRIGDADMSLLKVLGHGHGRGMVNKYEIYRLKTSVYVYFDYGFLLCF